jgi:hypothetical protein
MGDLENGLWGGNERYNPNLASVDSEYVTAMLKGGANNFAIKFGDAASGNLTTGYDGPRPANYQPMKKQGAILLGIVRERPLKEQDALRHIGVCARAIACSPGTLPEQPELTQAAQQCHYLTRQPLRVHQGGDNSDSAIGTFFEVRRSTHPLGL